MCNCNDNNNGNGNTIAVAFRNQQTPIASVFSKYGMGDMQVTPENALIGAVAYGTDFAVEVARAAAGLATESSYTAEENAANLSLADSIFNMFGIAAGAGINIAKGISDIKNGNKATGTPGTPGTPGQPQVVYLPATPPAPTTTGGFTNMQIGLLLVAVALVVGVLVYFGNKNKG